MQVLEERDFPVSELIPVASERSIGKEVAFRGKTHKVTGMQQAIAMRPDIAIFSAGGDTSLEWAPRFAEAGTTVVDNSSAWRMDPTKKLIIPEINASHLEIVERQKTRSGNGGFIVTNPNCSTIVLALAIYPVFVRFGLDKVMAVTMQAISGGGYPGVPSMDILGNVIPYIGGEEEKIERELAKIFGRLEDGRIVPADFTVSATCNRVPVRDGHTVCVSFSTRTKAGREELLDAMGHCYTGLKLHSSPEKVLAYNPSEDRPQPLMDVLAGNGMTVTAGRLRPCGILDWKMTAFGHNTVRGAAGAAILNAELIVERGFLKK